MTIYVDDLFTMTPRNEQARSHGNEWCHMVTDNRDLEELHLMAEKIGLKRSYFQPHATLPHYDLIPSKRALAIRYGAVAISAQELVKKNFEAHKPAVTKEPESPSVKDFWQQSSTQQYQLKRKVQTK